MQDARLAVGRLRFERLACGDDFIVKKAERSISSDCCLLEFDLDKKPDEQILEHIASMSKELICL